MASRTTLYIALAAALSFGALALGGNTTSDPGLKLGPIVRAQAAQQNGSSPVIIRAVDAASPRRRSGDRAGGGVRRPRVAHHQRSRRGRAERCARGLADHPSSRRSRSIAPCGNDGAHRRDDRRRGRPPELGYDGTGVGVAVIDSGVTSWHDDLGGATASASPSSSTSSNGRDAYDDYGHGTHVAGIIAGNGFDSGGARSGIAPGAQPDRAQGARRGGHAATSATSSPRWTTWSRTRTR